MTLWMNQLKNIAAKVASYSIKAADIGVTFTNRAATAAITFTLPPTGDLPSGWWCDFHVVDADGIVIASLGSADNIIAGNDTGADSITITTASLTIGAYGRVLWDGTSWIFARGGFGTYTVA